MHSHPCPGLAADWLNGWLAALGFTLMLPEVQLAWTAGPAPHAVLHTRDHRPLATQLADVFPDLADLTRLAVAEHAADPPIHGQNWSCEEYAGRAAAARAHGDFTLGACYTDLATDGRDPQRTTTGKSQFNVGAQGANPIGKRLRDCRAAITDPLVGWIEDTLTGHATRVDLNGLGFDYRRLTPTGVRADPVIEVLAFHGLAYLPVRGHGSQQPVTRGWTARPAQFTWIAWRDRLGAAGIDALLDQYWAGGSHRLATAVYASRSYNGKGQNDATRGYAAIRIGP